MQRLLTAGVLAPIVWYLAKRAPAPWFVAACVLCASAAAWEFYAMLDARGARPLRIVGVAAVALVQAASGGLIPIPAPETTVTALIVVALVVAMARREEPAAMYDTAVATIVPVLLCGLVLGHIARLRAIPGEDGSDLATMLLVCVMFGDSAAYYVGRSLGRRRMAPSISPKKSWEGAAGAFLGGALGAVLAHVWFFQRLGWGHALTVGALLAGAGILGDLAESMIKRATGVKDASGLLPGHGGMFDRLDSLMFSAPLLYYYWRIFLEGRV